MSDETFISAPLTPLAGTFAAQPMAAGVPGLPSGFTWDGRDYAVTEVLATWKQSSPEGGRIGGELYLRRHYFRLRMSDATIWTVYFVRQTPRSGSAKTRWFLYSSSSPTTTP